MSIDDVEVRRAAGCNIAVEPGLHCGTVSRGTQNARIWILGANDRGCVLAHTDRLCLVAGPETGAIRLVPELVVGDLALVTLDHRSHKIGKVFVGSGTV